MYILVYELIYLRQSFTTNPEGLVTGYVVHIVPVPMTLQPRISQAV